jgi:hypothetical protein
MTPRLLCHLLDTGQAQIIDPRTYTLFTAWMHPSQIKKRKR